jgi:hypothetical protein
MRESKTMDTMNKFGISGLVTLDKYDVDIWRVYFLGQLTVSKFASRAGAMAHLSSLRSGNRKPVFARAYNGKEVR